MVERKIGEQFEADGKLVECVESICWDCVTKEGKRCIFENGFLCKHEENTFCSVNTRKDGKDVCFIEVKE